MLLQFISGTTVSLVYDFFVSGIRTNVDNPYGKIFTPQKDLYSTVVLSQVSGVTGQYQYLFNVPSGATIGHWSTVGLGFTNNSNLFSSVQPFSIVDFAEEPLFIGVNDLRDYLAIPDSDHTKDELYQRILLTAISLIEKELDRTISVHNLSERIYIKHSPVALLSDYPVITISGMTVSQGLTGAKPSTPNTSSVNSSDVTDSFYFDLRRDSGVMHLLDELGNRTIYDGYYIDIDYQAGYLTVPEALRTAILMLASNIFNKSQSEGLEIVRFSDLQFSFEKGLFTKQIKDALSGFYKISIR